MRMALWWLPFPEAGHLSEVSTLDGVGIEASEPTLLW